MSDPFLLIRFHRVCILLDYETLYFMVTCLQQQESHWAWSEQHTALKN